MFRSRFKSWRAYLVNSTVSVALWVCGAGAAAGPPADDPIIDAEIQLMQGGLPPPPLQPAPIVQPPPIRTPPITGAEGGFRAPVLPEDVRRDVDAKLGGSSLGADVVGGSGAAIARNAPDVGSLLSNSPSATGIGIQKRNAVTGEARIRGYRVGQIVTYGDHGFFFPARQDLDSAVSKFDAGSVSDVIILKGPYSVRYGPGFAFINIDTLDTPRPTDGWKMEGRTSFGYDTNGEGISFIQGVEGGNCDWGFRVGYNLQVGNDYRAGDHRIVPSSYNSENATFAVGFNIGSGDHSKIEFKGFRLYQHDVEFAGSFFDIKHLDTESYSVRLTARDAAAFDLLTADAWFNYTGAFGNTLQGAKQNFLNPLLTASFFTEPGSTRFVRDFSSTFFSESSKGYRVAMTWGEQNCTRFTAGTDLNYVDQFLVEAIRLQQFGASSAIFPLPDPTLTANDPILRQDLGIPRSRLVDPGVFADITVPVNKRLTVTSGARGDLFYSNADARFVSGNVFLLPGNQFNPRAPGQIPGAGGPPAVLGFDPVVFSTAPNDNNLSRNFGLFMVYGTADYKIDDHLTSYIKGAIGQRAPTLTELYASGPFLALLQQGLNRTVGDPRLQKETNHQVDVGLIGNYTNVRFGANGFYAFIHDYITFDLTRGNNPATTQVVFTNTDEASLAGGELYSEVDLTERLTPFITVSYVQGRDLTHIDNRRAPGLQSSRRTLDTEPLPGIVPLELRSGFRFHDTDTRPAWTVEFAARSVMGQNLVASSLNELPTGGFTTFDVRGFWQVNDGLVLTGGVENFGDKFYREHLDSRAGDLLFRRGANIYVAAEMKY